MKHYAVHPDYRKLQIPLPLYRSFIPLLQRMTRLMYARQPIPSTINYSKTSVLGHDGYAIPIEIFSPISSVQKVPCILFIHGGAFALPATDYHKKLVFDYALGCPAKVIMVDYRLAPQYPYPYGLKDCLAAYTWIHDHVDNLGIDSTRIALCGDSAGGALTAGLAYLINDQALPVPRFQMLVYPVLDSQQESPSMQKFTDTPIRNARLNRKMWNIYLQGTIDKNNAVYASPAQNESYTGLPNTYIEVNEYDCLRDEAISYYHKLKKNSANVVLNQTTGTIHGFELNYTSAYTRKILEKRITYMKEQFLSNPEG